MTESVFWVGSALMKQHLACEPLPPCKLRKGRDHRFHIQSGTATSCQSRNRWLWLASLHPIDWHHHRFRFRFLTALLPPPITHFVSVSFTHTHVNCARWCESAQLQTSHTTAKNGTSYKYYPTISLYRTTIKTFCSILCAGSTRTSRLAPGQKIFVLSEIRSMFPNVKKKRK